jgi:hypothetical protein
MRRSRQAPSGSGRQIRSVSPQCKRWGLVVSLQKRGNFAGKSLPEGELLDAQVRQALL